VFGASKGQDRFNMGRRVRVAYLVAMKLPLYSAPRPNPLSQSLDRDVSMDIRALDDLAKKLAASVPEGLIHLRDDLEKNFRSVLQSGLAKLDVVTRQEFDVQAGVLKRTREKLEALEARLAELEAAGKK
jgi:BMFP domain-containing protein YqiC